MIRWFVLYLGMAVLLGSCSSTAKKTTIADFFKNDSIPIREKMEKAVSEEYLLDLGFTNDQAQWVKNFYAGREYAPLWINDSTRNSEGNALTAILDRSIWYGIPQNRVQISTLRKKKHLWIDQELILTARLSRMINDLNNGFMDLTEKKYLPETFCSAQKLDSVLNERNTSNMEKALFQQGIEDSNYRFLSLQLYKFCKIHGLENNSVLVPDEKEDSVNAQAKAAVSLFNKRYLDTLNPDPEVFESALKTFQKDNGLREDGKVGEATSIALQETNLHKAHRAALVLEKIRKHDKFPSKYVLVNIPEYLLRLVIRDTLVQTHRIIVGKPEHMTPELRSRIHNIALYPYWNVPYSIAGKEVLPSVKANSNYLSKNHYKIYRGDTEIDPSTVAWKGIRKNTFPYKLVQQPGTHNSLGIVKFEFHSQYSVYIHDTPTKYLFSRDVRAMSHGCMRCQFPDSLAKTILTNDSVRKKANPVNGLMIDSLLSLNEHMDLKLLNPVPVYVEYKTVSADRERMIFYQDIYARDEPYLKLMMH
jgi:murein L,D-transpeptidase YcbB/YkuD